ncbi:MAG: CARDB domain-containing protein, partial [Bacteroidia bacterium]
KVWAVHNNNTGGWGAWGINLTGGNNHIVANNVVYDVRAMNYSATSNTFNPFGIRITSGNNIGVYYNSIYMYGTMTNTNWSTASAAGFGVTATSVTGEFRNNVIGVDYNSNATGARHFAAVWFPASYSFSNFTINNNAYHVANNANHFVGRIGTTANTGLYDDVDVWKAISSVGNASNDQQSVPPSGKSLPPYTSLTDLTIPAMTPTPIESGGVVILRLDTPNIDYTGLARPAGTGTAPDMGAYEFEGISGNDIFPPTIDSFTVTPALNQCVPTTRTVTVFARDNIGGSGVDSVMLQYTINGVAGTPILLSLSSGTAAAGAWTGTLPAATAAGQVLSATVIASDSANNPMSNPVAIGAWIDDYLVPNAGPDTTIIAGDTATLRGSGGSNLVTLGTGTLVNTTTSYPAPYGNYWWGARHQFLILASELQAIGAAAGPMTSLAFDVASAQGVPLVGFEIKMKGTTATSMTSWETGLTTVYTVPSFTEVAGWNTHLFTTPFNWNGADNIVIEICFNNTSWTNNAIVNQSSTPFVSSIWYNADASGVCGNPATNSTASQRPNMQIGSSFQSNWTNLSTGAVVLTNTPVAQVTPTVTTQYEYELFDNNCSKRDTMTVFVTPNNIDDIGVSAIISPVTVTELNQPNTVKIVIENFGTVAAAGFDVAYTVNGTEINSNSIARSIAPGDTIHHIFSQAWTPTTGGDLRLCAFTRSFAGDANAANDTTCATFNAVNVKDVNDLIGRVYPNPANQFVKFDFAAQEGVGTLEIRDNLGR